MQGRHGIPGQLILMEQLGVVRVDPLPRRSRRVKHLFGEGHLVAMAP